MHAEMVQTGNATYPFNIFELRDSQCHSAIQAPVAV